MTDYISREAAIKAISTAMGKVDRKIMRDRLMSIPAADVRPVVRGKWKHDKDGLVWCLNCGFGKERSDERAYHFCPNCGACMEES